MHQEIFTVVSRNGQLTIPAGHRRQLGLREGDKVAIRLSDTEEGTMYLRPVTSVADATFGAANRGGVPADLTELRRAFEEGVADEVIRQMRSSDR